MITRSKQRLSTNIKEEPKDDAYSKAEMNLPNKPPPNKIAKQEMKCVKIEGMQVHTTPKSPVLSEAPPVVQQEKEIKVAPEEPKPCCVCYKEKITDPARLDGCEHVLCFLCLKSWLFHNMSCCICRAVPRENIIRNPGTNKESLYPISEVEKEKLKEQREQAGSSVPLVTERLIIRKGKAEYSAMRDEMQNPRTRRRGRYTYPRQPSRAAQRDIMDSIHALDFLREQNSRHAVVSHPEFRKLIYRFNAEWHSAAAENSLNRGGTYSPIYVIQHEQAERERLSNFILKELNNVEYKPGMGSRLETTRRRIAETIFKRMMDTPIQAPNFFRLLCFEYGIQEAHARRFQQELFNIAASGLTEDDFYRVSCYALPRTNGTSQDGIFAVGGLNQNQSGVGPRQPMVVTIESDADDDDIRVEHETIMPNNESNYVRDDPVSSDSERGELFSRRACLFGRPLPQLPPFHPGTGISYNLFGAPTTWSERRMTSLYPERRHPMGLNLRTSTGRNLRRGAPEEIDLSSSDQGSTAGMTVPPYEPRSPEIPPYEPRSPDIIHLDVYEPRSPEIPPYEPTSPEIPPYEPRSPEMPGMAGLQLSPQAHDVRVQNDQNSSIIEVHENEASSSQGSSSSRRQRNKIDKYHKKLSKEFKKASERNDRRTIDKLIHYAKKLLRDHDKNERSRGHSRLHTSGRDSAGRYRRY